MTRLLIFLLQIKISDCAGTRTQDPYIKSVMLYQLSYAVIYHEQKTNNFTNNNIYVFIWQVGAHMIIPGQIIVLNYHLN